MDAGQVYPGEASKGSFRSILGFISGPLLAKTTRHSASAVLDESCESCYKDSFLILSAFDPYGSLEEPLNHPEEQCHSKHALMDSHV